MFQGFRDALARSKARKEGLIEYGAALDRFLAAGTDQEMSLARNRMDTIAKEAGLEAEAIKGVQRVGMLALGDRVLAEGRLTASEAEMLERRGHALGSSLKEWGIDPQRVAIALMIPEIEAGRLPTLAHPEGLALDKDEILHMIHAATLSKRKQVTKALHYGGITTSFKIMKGVRFRTGNLGVARSTSVQVVGEDRGLLLITNRRILFLGAMKRFDFKLAKISSMILSGAGLEITKAGREAPYIFTMEDYGVPVALLSALSEG